MTERLAQLKRLHEMDPADPFCTYGIALEHAKAGEIPAALEWLDRTLEADPGYAYAVYQQGRLLAESGELGRAREVLASGIERYRASEDPDTRHAAEEMAELLDSL